MGKSLKGKELGKGITQRKDGTYQARYTDRFGKRKTLYGKTYSDITKKLRDAQYEDERELNVADSNMTLDEWFDIWMDTCKKNCRNTTKENYIRRYKYIKEALGWRKLSSLNLVVMQQAINDLKTDYQRKDVKVILVDMLDKAINSDLLIKNVARQLNTTITKEEKRERRVLNKKEIDIFLKYAENTFYYNLYVIALETGMRISELTGLQWDDIDFDKKIINVSHNYVYFNNNGKYCHEMHDTKTKSGRRTIPLTNKAYETLKKQNIKRKEILLKNGNVQDEHTNLVFVNSHNKPICSPNIQQCVDLIIKNINKIYPEFEHFSLHCFRHSFATQAIESGVQPKTLQKILGHASLQMTMDLYCHVTDDALFEAVEALERNRA